MENLVFVLLLPFGIRSHKVHTKLESPVSHYCHDTNCYAYMSFPDKLVFNTCVTVVIQCNKMLVASTPNKLYKCVIASNERLTRLFTGVQWTLIMQNLMLTDCDDTLLHLALLND